MTDLQAEYDRAVTERDELQAELGDAVIAGQDTAKIRAKLVKAEEAVLGCSMAIEAVAAAGRRADQRQQQEVDRLRQVEIEKRWSQARTDHADIMATAQALQRNFEKQRELAARLHHQARAFCNNHKPLGLNFNAGEVLNRAGWQGQMLLTMRETFPGMRERLAKVYIDAGDPAKSIVDSIPEFDRLLPARAQREAA